MATAEACHAFVQQAQAHRVALLSPESVQSDAMLTDDVLPAARRALLLVAREAQELEKHIAQAAEKRKTGYNPAGLSEGMRQDDASASASVSALFASQDTVHIPKDGSDTEERGGNGVSSNVSGKQWPGDVQSDWPGSFGLNGKSEIDIDAFAQQLKSVRGMKATQREQFVSYSKERLAHDDLSDTQMQQRRDLQRAMCADAESSETQIAARDERGVEAGSKKTDGNEAASAATDLESECGDVDVLEHDDDDQNLCA